MAIIVPLNMFIGVSLAIYSGLLGPMLDAQIENDPLYKNKSSKEREGMILSGMAVMGIGDALGGPLMGFFIDKITSKYSNFITLVVTIFTGFVIYINMTELRYDYLSYLMCFMWGLQDAFINVIALRIMGFEFEP